MSIGAIDIDANDFNLQEWLENDEAKKLQRHLESKIIDILFSHDPSSTDFQKMAAQLAWLGASPSQKALIEREIAALHFSNDYVVQQCGLFKDIGKVCSKVGKFVANHAAEIAIGATVAATGAGIAFAIGYTVSVSVGSVIVAGTGSVFLSGEKANQPIPLPPLPDPHACSKQELEIYNQPVSSSLPELTLPSSINELLVTKDGIWANGQFISANTLMQHSSFSSVLSANSPQEANHCPADWKTFTYYNYLSGQLTFETGLSHQTLGENALALGYYDVALQDFEKAAAIDPTHSIPYLQRGIAHFGLGQYERSLEDFEQFTIETQETTPLSISEFTLSFAKGLPKGIYESGEGMLLFFADFIQHPIATSKQVIDSIAALAKLIRNDQWGNVAEALSPEIVQLVTQWDTLPSDKKGELAGYAIGKLGADILAPGALAKIGSKSAKSARELVAVCKNLQIAQETLLLETAAGIGIPAKVAEIVEMGKKTATFAEELGLSAKEMGQLQQAGKLEATIAKNYQDFTPSMLESFELHQKARDALKPYGKQCMPEAKVRELIHETGMPTFPRPEGIPANYVVSLSDKGAGMKYIHPQNNQIFVRVMPGKAHSPFPHQQKPYVVQMKDGKAVDKLGNKVDKRAPEAHIPIDEFVYRQ